MKLGRTVQDFDEVDFSCSPCTCAETAASRKLQLDLNKMQTETLFGIINDQQIADDTILPWEAAEILQVIFPLQFYHNGCQREDLFEFSDGIVEHSPWIFGPTSLRSTHLSIFPSLPSIS